MRLISWGSGSGSGSGAVGTGAGGWTTGAAGSLGAAGAAGAAGAGAQATSRMVMTDNAIITAFMKTPHFLMVGRFLLAYGSPAIRSRDASSRLWVSAETILAITTQSARRLNAKDQVLLYSLTKKILTKNPMIPTIIHSCGNGVALKAMITTPTPETDKEVYKGCAGALSSDAKTFLYRALP